VARPLITSHSATTTLRQYLIIAHPKVARKQGAQFVGIKIAHRPYLPSACEQPVFDHPYIGHNGLIPGFRPGKVLGFL
jgi:hypothetical protein